MTTTEIIISKANGIRFADRNSGDPFENLISCEEIYLSKVAGKVDQILFNSDTFLLQIKAGLTATVVLRKYDETGSYTTITEDNTETYTTFKVYEYLITVSSIERFYLQATSESSELRSEWIDVIAEDTSMMLLQWTNYDDSSNTFEFDYTTDLAVDNVNFMRLPGEMVNYKPTGESTVYDNQNEKSKIKGNVYRNLTFVSDKIPRQVAEIITIASQHDRFVANSAGYIAEDLPEIEMVGAFCEVSIDLTLGLALGINTHDIGFDCDSITNTMIENKLFEDATGSDSASVSAGYGLTQIVSKLLSGSPTLTVGTTPGGNEILRTTAITSIPKIINTRYTPNTDTSWTIYFVVAGGTVDAFFQTIMFNDQP